MTTRYSKIERLEFPGAFLVAAHLVHVGWRDRRHLDSWASNHVDQVLPRHFVNQIIKHHRFVARSGYGKGEFKN